MFNAIPAIQTVGNTFAGEQPRMRGEAITNLSGVLMF